MSAPTELSDDAAMRYEPDDTGSEMDVTVWPSTVTCADARTLLSLAPHSANPIGQMAEFGYRPVHFPVAALLQVPLVPTAHDVHTVSFRPAPPKKSEHCEHTQETPRESMDARSVTVHVASNDWMWTPLPGVLGH